MSEAPTGPPSDLPSDQPGDRASAGAMLREAREKQGLHIAALAAAIKVAPRKLDALEHDRWDELPDATFVRALAQTVCRTLKIDARPVLERLPRAGTPTLDPGAGSLNAPFRERPGRDEQTWAISAVRPMVWAAAALMGAALLVYFAPEGLFSPRAAAPVTVAPTPASAASATAVASSAASAASEPLARAVAELEPPASAAASAPAAPSPPAAPAAAAEPMVASPRPVLADAASAAGPVQVRTSGTSWIEARDGSGRLLLSRTLLAGESLGLDGALPIRLTIGNASATQLAFQGRTIDLAPSTRENVARVELK